MGLVKRLSREQVEGRKEKAVRFTDDVLGDPDRADEIADESPEDYAARKGIEIVSNHAGQQRRKAVANIPTREELKERITELEEENQELQDRLDSIGDIVGSEDDAEEGEDDSEDDDED